MSLAGNQEVRLERDREDAIRYRFIRQTGFIEREGYRLSFDRQQAFPFSDCQNFRENVDRTIDRAMEQSRMWATHPDNPRTTSLHENEGPTEGDENA